MNLLLVGLFVLLTFSFVPAAISGRIPNPELGKAVFDASGGCGCHTDRKNDGREMAGGRAIATPFGIVYSSNITPDPETGIGSWTDDDFIQAMTLGLSPDGRHYFPVFPYTSFAGMNGKDLLHLKDYLFSLPPVRRKNREHEMAVPFFWQPALFIWKSLFFAPRPYAPNPSRSASWNRGAYLANAVSHCGECHTPRNLMGGLKTGMLFAGSKDGPEGELAPNITPDKTTGIGRWKRNDLIWFLESGMNPDGDFVQGLMAEVIDHGYRNLPKSDLRAITEYLRSLPPIKIQVAPEKTKKVKEEDL